MATSTSTSTPTFTPVRVCFIRHGPDVKDPKHPHDEKLTPCTRQRAVMEKRCSSMCKSSHYGQPDRVYTSPYQRTSQTATLFASVVRELRPDAALEIEAMPELSRYSGADSGRTRLTKDSSRAGARQVKSVSEMQQNIRTVMQLLFRKHTQALQTPTQPDTPLEAEAANKETAETKEVLIEVSDIVKEEKKIAKVWCITHGSFLRELYKLIRGGTEQLGKDEDKVKPLQILQLEIRNPNGSFVEISRPKSLTSQSLRNTDSDSKPRSRHHSERHEMSHPKRGSKQQRDHDRDHHDRDRHHDDQHRDDQHHSDQRHSHGPDDQGTGERRKHKHRHHSPGRSSSSSQHHQQHQQQQQQPRSADPTGFLQALLAPLTAIGQGKPLQEQIQNQARARPGPPPRQAQRPPAQQTDPKVFFGRA